MHSADDAYPESEDAADRVDAFDEAWHLSTTTSSAVPNIDEFTVSESHVDRLSQLQLLIAIDLERRWSLGADDHRKQELGISAPPLLEHYGARFPELPHSTDLSADLICAEYRARLLWGDRPGRLEYQGRFGSDPELMNALRHVETELQEEADCDFYESLKAQHRGQPRDSELPDLPGYEIQSIIGHGGKGVVYKAWHCELKRIVAVKTILSGRFAPEQEIQRFRSEAKAAARLNHPNIVKIFDSGSYGGIHFFSMEYIQGKSLSEVIRDNPLNVLQAAKYVWAVSQAAHYAHDQGVLHRDLKPSNILIDNQGHPYISDFGLSKRIENRSDLTNEDLHLTGANQVLGTPSYVPPEQVCGDQTHLGRATDVYGLGATLYHALSGRPPFQGDSWADTLHQVQFNEPVSPRQLQPKIPRDLETICLRCLEKDPTRRYETAHELAADLDRFINHLPIKARPIGRIGTAWRWCRRQPMTAALFSTSVALLCLVIVVMAVSSIRNSRAYVRELNQRRITEQALDRELEANRQVYHSQIRQGFLEYGQNNLAETKRILERTIPQPGGTDWRGWEWYHLNSLRETSLYAFQAGQEPAEWVYSLAFDPKGKWIAAGTGVPTFLDRRVSSPASLKIWDIRSGDLVLDVAGPTLSIVSLSFSPDGETLAALEQDYYFKEFARNFDGPGSIRRWHVESGRELEPIHVDSHFSMIAFTPDGKHVLAESRSEKLIKLWDTESAQQICTFQQTSFWGFDSESHTLVGKNHDQQLVSCEVPGGAQSVLERKTLPGTPSPSGTYVAHISAGAESISIRRVETGSLVRTIQNDAITEIVFDDRERLFALGTANGEVIVWDLVEGRTLFTLRGHSDRIKTLQFNPEGNLLASGDWGGKVRMWRTDRHPEYLSLGESRDDNARVEAMAFTRNSEQLVSFKRLDKHISIWNLKNSERSTKKVVPIPLHSNSPGRRMALNSEGDHFCIVNSIDNCEVDVWAVESEEKVLCFSLHSLPVQFARFSRDGSSVMSSAFSMPDDNDQLHETKFEVMVWRVESGDPLFTFRGTGNRVWRLDQSSDGRYLGIASTRYIKERGSIRETTQILVRDMIDEKWILDHETPATLVLGLAFSHDGKTLATSDYSRGRVTLWDFVSGHAKLSFDSGVREIEDLAFSPDGKRLAAVTRNVLGIWETTSGKNVLTKRQPASVDLIFNPQVLFSHDGRMIATNQHDDTIRVWSSGN